MQSKETMSLWRGHGGRWALQPKVIGESMVDWDGILEVVLEVRGLALWFWGCSWNPFFHSHISTPHSPWVLAVDSRCLVESAFLGLVVRRTSRPLETAASLSLGCLPALSPLCCSDSFPQPLTGPSEDPPRPCAPAPHWKSFWLPPPGKLTLLTLCRVFLSPLCNSSPCSYF